ncbi:MAG: hypothetical protein ABI438_03560, partial [Dermatophilaceae bacterium]
MVPVIPAVRRVFAGTGAAVTEVAVGLAGSTGGTVGAPEVLLAPRDVVELNEPVGKGVTEFVADGFDAAVVGAAGLGVAVVGSAETGAGTVGVGVASTKGTDSVGTGTASVGTGTASVGTGTASVGTGTTSMGTGTVSVGT